MTRVVFCGVGALGSHAAVLSRNLTAGGLPIAPCLVDFDRVESKNLLSQAFVKPSIGKNKADALKAQLLNFYSIKAESFGVRITDENVETLLGKSDLVVDCFDNARGREVLSRFCRSTLRPLVHAAISADGSFGLVRWDERFVADVEDQEGQATCETGDHLPLITLVASVLARTLQDFLANGEQRDSLVSLKSVTPTT